jgi:ABC-type phosphate/phosphonate transport system ATPase subunit
MKQAAIVGNAGAGKYTLARRLAALTGLPLDTRIMGIEFKRSYAARRPVTAIRSACAPDGLRGPAREPLALPP